jgi:hydrogenase-4 component F
LGLGKTAAFGVLLYALSNALVKALLFLTCGAIKARFHTKNTADLHGLIKDMPYSGLFFMAGVFALLGFAPFGSFFGEVIIMSSLVEQGRIVVFTLFCILLTVIFVATGRSIFPMIWGEPTLEGKGARESLFTVMPNLFFVLLLFAMGIYLPSSAIAFLQGIAAQLGGA